MLERADVFNEAVLRFCRSGRDRQGQRSAGTGEVVDER